MTDAEFETAHNAAPAVQERNYLLRRADDHRRLALNAVEPNIRATHLTMQRLYEDRAARFDLIQTHQEDTQKYQERPA